MKTITARDLQKNVRGTVESSQDEIVVITRHGKPAAVIHGVEGLGWEEIVLANDASFWKMLRARRKERTVSQRELDESL